MIDVSLEVYIYINSFIHLAELQREGCREKMDCGYKPYFDPDFESLIERIYPPRVVVDNETCQNSTLVKVDSKNKHGILLEMVQVLTDLDLLISKSYISSDGGWFMDVFHVTDQLGNKVTDDTLIHYIQQALCARRGSSKSKSKGGGNGAKEAVVQQKKWLPGSVVGSSQMSSTEYTAFEMTATDRPGLLSEVSAVLAQLGCHVAAAAAWTHNTRAACIFYVEDEKNYCSNNNKGGGRSDESTATSAGGGIISDESRLAEMEEQLENVVGAHHGNGERKMVRLASPAAARTHMERRLHQLMYADGDYEEVELYNGGGRGGRGGYTSTSSSEPEVSIANCNERGYSVVNVRCTDRPKLLFDTVCTLTDMEYVVFHAAISSKGSLAIQEYYIRHVDGCTMDTESERRRVIQCLVAAIERRVSHGLKLDLCTRNRVGLLSDVTRVFREHGLSVSRAEIGTRGEKAIGSFYVTDASGNDADPRTVELLRKEIGVTALEISRSSPGRPSYRSSSNSSSNNSSSNNINTCSVDLEERATRSSSLGSLLWAQLGRFSSNFGPIKS